MFETASVFVIAAFITFFIDKAVGVMENENERRTDEETGCAGECVGEPR